jgi:hypothetical protein
VAPTVFQALDKAIEAGSTNLVGKDIAPSRKGPSPVLDELCTAGFLSKTGGKTPKYSVTPSGRAAWEREAPPDRRRQVQEREQERQRKALPEFLALVGQKPGKPLTRTELALFPDPLRQDACGRKLVESGTKANTYRLLPAGEDVLQAEQPIEQQVQRLRQQQQQTVAQWRTAQQRLRQEVEGFAGRGGVAVQAAVADLGERSRQAAQAFEAALAELGAFAGLLAAARQLREGVETACQGALRRVEAENGRLAELEARLRQGAEQQREQLEAFERRVGERLDDLARRPARGTTSSAEPPTPQSGGGAPPDDAVWQATRRAHERLREETLRIGGIVKVPDLTDAVVKSAPSLTPPTFHDLLRRWQQEDRLTLQLCNDPRLEPRAAEGIQSPRGLLFYVQMR